MSIVCAGVSSRRLSFSLLHVCTVEHSAGLRCGHGEYLFVSRPDDANITGRICFSKCFEWLSLAWQFAKLNSGPGRFLRTNIFRGSASTCLRNYDGVFNYRFTTNLLLSLSAKEFSKSVTFAKVRDESIVAAFFQNTIHTAFFSKRCAV